MADCQLMFHLQPAHWSWAADGGGCTPVEREPNLSVSVHLYSLFLVPFPSCWQHKLSHPRVKYMAAEARAGGLLHAGGQ